MSDESFNIDFSDGFFYRTNQEHLIMPPHLSLYLAGPLTCNNADMDKECLAIREAIKSAFEKYDWLGTTARIYDPAEVTSPNSHHTAEQVYETDHLCTVNADAIIFHINGPSLGMGIESQLSASATTPRIVIRKKGMPLSRMFRGLTATTFADVEYDSAAEVYNCLSELRPEIFPRMIESAERRRPHVDELRQRNFGKQFLQMRIKRQISRLRLATLTDIPEWWIESLERNSALAPTISLIQIERIAEVLECHWKVQNRKFDISDHDDTLQPYQSDSLASLATFVTDSDQLSEEGVLAIWSEYIVGEKRISEEAMAYRGYADPIPLAPADWRQRYNERKLF